ncbi:hypothetical protein [Oceanobacillus salinisoli]|nr:hypothetical protein [Oceanobacillus salinisoli]
MSPITGRLFDKYGGRILAVVGLSIVAVSTFMLSNPIILFYNPS